jgi:5,10-methylene-tetrahydrofolate dehydrogenase/methenyl tetrahydrofolate cyclohydrolase
MPRSLRRLVAILIGDDAASRSFIAVKERAARDFGIIFEFLQIPSGMPQEAVVARLKGLAADCSVGGIVLQLPLPSGYDRAALISAIGLRCDVDNLSGLSAVPAPAVSAVRHILASRVKNFSDYRAVRIVGGGFLVGAPIAAYCAAEGIPYAVATAETPDLQAFLKGADLVITGTGRAGLIDPLWVPSGAGIIDFGCPSDFSQEFLVKNAARFSFYTPTPGGTGPVLVASLFENFYILNSLGGE